MKHYKLQKTPTKLASFKRMLLNHMDLYGQPVQLKLNKEMKSTSILGIVLSLMIIVLCSLVFLTLVQEVITQNKPSIVLSEVSSFATNDFVLQQENFTMVVVITDKKLKAIPGGINKYFTIQVENCMRERILNETNNNITIETSCQYYEFESCTLERHLISEQQRTYFAKHRLQNLYCIKPDQFKNRPLVFYFKFGFITQILQGQVYSKQYQYININIEKCQNTTNLTTCASLDEIENKLNAVYYGVYLNDNLIDLEKKGSPSTQDTRLFTYPATNSTQLSINSYYRVYRTITDDGLFTNETYQEDILQYQSDKASVAFSGSSFWIYHHIDIDKKITIYKRTYQKVQTIFAQIGGLWNVLFYTFQLLISPLSFFLMHLKLINKLFNFQNSQGDEAHQSKSIGISKMVSPKMGQDMNFLTSNRKLVKQILFYIFLKQHPSRTITKNLSSRKYKEIQSISDGGIVEYLRHKKHSISIGLRQVLKFFISKLYVETAQVNYGIEKVKKMLDVLYIFEKLHEIDKLKMVLLNKDQIRLFNYLPRSTIPFDVFEAQEQSETAKLIKEKEENSQFFTFVSEEKTNQLKLHEAYQSFQNLRSQNIVGEVDQKFLNFLDPEIKELFDKFYEKPQPIVNRMNNKILDYQVDLPGDLEQSIIIQQVRTLPQNKSVLPYSTKNKKKQLTEHHDS